MASAVSPLGSLSMARGCARIDAGPDTAKIGSADCVQVHHARLLAVIGVRKTFPHGLGHFRTSTRTQRVSALSRRTDLLSQTGQVRFMPTTDSASTTFPSTCICCSLPARKRVSRQTSRG
jgi:hypothetical protein